LDSLIEEFEEEGQFEEEEEEESNKSSKEEIAEYIEYIRGLKESLNAILEEQNKKSEDETELQRLVREHNLKMDELKKRYRFMRLKLKGDPLQDGLFKTNAGHSLDSLNHNKKRRRIEEIKHPFEALEIVKLGSERSENDPFDHQKE
jgi:hypothetical protein